MGSRDYTGRTVDKYRLLQCIGRGGMGAVYRGEHTLVGRKVAVKFLHSELTDNVEIVKRFYREAQASAAIGHRNIIDVLDVGVSSEGEPYIVMEFLEGESLSGLIKRKWPLDLATACGIMEPALKALGAAHAKGIVHRDLKPDNIFLAHVEGEPPLVKLIDFGISKFTRSDMAAKLTQTGSIMGTPAYMAPEQARGVSDVDQRADLYSMGVIFFEMLTGGLPFKGESYNDLIVRILTEPPRSPRQVYAGFPVEAEAVVMRALEKDPARRFQDSGEMLRAIGGLSAFGQREEYLTSIAGTLRSRIVAGGDLGFLETQGASGSVASELLGEISGQETPSRWTGTGVPGTGRPRWKSGVVAAVAALAAVGVIVAVALGLSGGRAPAAAPATAPAAGAPGANAPTDEGVLVTVEGVPAGARITYDKVPVPVNPFRVKKGATIVSIGVEAPGFQPFATSIVPSSDQVVRVSLVPIAGQPARPPVNRAVAPPTRAPASSDKRKKMGAGGRGTTYTEDFE